MIETWGFYFLPPQRYVPLTELTPDDIQGAYDRYVDLWVNCERWGFDGLARTPFRHDPVTLTAPVRRNGRGADPAAPVHDGRRFAEECGMLDYLTHGRYEPGIAPGAGPSEATRCVPRGRPRR